MTVNRYAVVRTSDSAVVNIVAWDGDTKTWQPPEGHTARIATASDKIADTSTPSEQNKRTIEQQAAQALDTNRAFVASTPSPAQVAAQVKALSQQNIRIIRLLLNQTEDVN